jgi:hypothetical protein
MPTTIYDSSLITQRHKAKAESDSFLSRIQNPVNPTTSYGLLAGIYDQSIINSVNNGQMKFFRKAEGCTVISNGCPCPPLSNEDTVTIPPGPIPYINVTYGSVIVEWGEPTTGTRPFTYLVYAMSNSSPTVISNPTYNTRYVFQTSDLISGIEYTFKVAVFNNAGSSNMVCDTPVPAPYGSPSVSAALNGTTPGSIILTINSSPFNPLSNTAEYNIYTYLNNIPTVVSNFQQLGTTTYPININLSNLQSSYLYSFKVQIKDSDTELSSYSTGTTNLRPLPGAPQNVAWYALSSTSIRVTYNNFSEEAGGFDLMVSTCIITNGYSLYLNTSNLTNTSVDIINLSPGTTYYDFTLQFVYASVNSLISNIPIFTTL